MYKCSTKKPIKKYFQVLATLVTTVPQKNTFIHIPEVFLEKLEYNFHRTVLKSTSFREL